jgi:hypothetical protein
LNPVQPAPPCRIGKETTDQRTDYSVLDQNEP